MYFRMLKHDIKDKPGLNIVAFIFMISAVTFTVIGSTMIYSLFGGEKKTYDKCNSSDVYMLLDQSIADRNDVVESFSEDLNSIPIVVDTVNDEVVVLGFPSIEFIGEDVNETVHYS